ncbi:holo-[acyl-carrier-protein] synthase [Clostridium pasteurianum DSM 525 = ATCC 6013]|uniref:Holo-[acyl-carrier-protein] synthase n=1 Tax=Clostridium pasteurianum DSM 525 = ATCC 6013 TaxID=1262449 RepID=A0A0H3J4M5_CLOPA|nr:holo-ACP synthase [Clostridium pasteurianum]AJA48861.1 holo-[acyl-carrier-protein] synthase [Clostridium pasteurianum DSM 525 = ATCC 6013]AJA52849.1 holo-[acyl-carrier-protein] synthase [Clostridium pasteurianum DSM 525 = ATCC 6013]AOZ76073.1 4'-phosphopantetheinyl transferase [Clostridium pasteurianum DSM 525 = ATCC 6013]AOZ79869.1 4'-phosphopantetheinyl transferase [Clostridium pasteurianum]ELP60157.1 4'-phosphopantetheinyl transferase [Clostridium pasteurianum DSM 525 = ATCC 6013]
MILGVGIDIVEINRIRDAIEKNSLFLKKVYTQNEIEYLKSRNLRPEYAAGRFAAKEAVSKALGTGFMQFSIRDIEIDRNVKGKPVVILKGKAKQIANKFGDYKIHLSISHSKENAIAYAILEVI